MRNRFKFQNFLPSFLAFGFPTVRRCTTILNCKQLWLKTPPHLPRQDQQNVSFHKRQINCTRHLVYLET